MVTEVSKYYLKKDSDVYTCAIDANKAFDRVQHDKLFLLLIERGLPAAIVGILYDGYKRQKMHIMWKGCTSESFDTLKE